MHRPNPEHTHEPEPTPTPSAPIWKQLSRSELNRAAIAGEIEIDHELAAIEQALEVRIAQIKRKQHRAWSMFAARLIGHGRALLEQGMRIAELAPMPTQR